MGKLHFLITLLLWVHGPISNNLSIVAATESQYIRRRAENVVNHDQSEEYSRTLNENLYDAVIIGAGWAGLAAANQLKEKGVTNFRILEARNYIGGRSVTFTGWGKDAHVDLGSSWVHGINGNPVQKIVVDNKIPFDLEDHAGTSYYLNNGQAISETAYTAINSKYEQFFGYQEDLQDATDNDTDLEGIKNQFLAEQSAMNDDILGVPAFETFVEGNIEDEYASDLDTLSHWWFDGGGELTGGDSYLAVANSGFSRAIDALAEPIKDSIETNSKVTVINTQSSEDETVITFSKINSSGASTFVKSIRAKKVLVTVPLGVLKANDIKFIPEMKSLGVVGQRKAEAIKNLGMGLLNKCVLYWDNLETVFWDNNEQWLDLILPLNQQDTAFTSFYNPHSLKDVKPMLIGFVSGDKARYIESLSDRQVVNNAMKSLKTMYGPNIPRPTHHKITRWEADPFSKGSYSYWAIGSKNTSRQYLFDPINNRLYFAGEATDSLYPSTTHGAYRSGVNAACQILQSLGKGSCSNNIVGGGGGGGDDGDDDGDDDDGDDDGDDDDYDDDE